MTQATWLAVAALVLGAIAILPGTLGVLMFTKKLAATGAGARWIYGQAKWALLISIALMVGAVWSALQHGTYSNILGATVVAFGGVLVFGFLMHVSLNFKPVRIPTFIKVNEAMDRFGPDEEVVGVVDAAGKPYAFITRLARRPHVIYQPHGECPFVMSHCILSHSSMSYATKGSFANPDIMVVAVLANNMVFYEKNKQCAVIQIQNRSRRGDLDLETLSTVSVKLKTWQRLFPESAVWFRDKEWRDTFYLKLLSRANVIDPASPAMVYATQHELDQRLPMKAQVLGLEFGEDHCAYPTSLFKDTPIVNDKLGGRSVLIAAAFESDFIQIFDREIEPGRILKFKALDSDDGFSDTSTGSAWSPAGLCVEGELKGQRLAAIPHYNRIFWYVWADFHVNTRIYSME